MSTSIFLAVMDIDHNKKNWGKLLYWNTKLTPKRRNHEGAPWKHEGRALDKVYTYKLLDNITKYDLQALVCRRRFFSNITHSAFLLNNCKYWYAVKSVDDSDLYLWTPNEHRVARVWSHGACHWTGETSLCKIPLRQVWKLDEYGFWMSFQCMNVYFCQEEIWFCNGSKWNETIRTRKLTSLGFE